MENKKSNWTKPLIYGIIGFNGFIWGMFGGQYLFQPTNAVIKDVNKDGIEDIITYRNNKKADTFIGVKDSCNTITYVEAESYYKQKRDSLEIKYNREKSQLEKALEQK